jgi:hypothetical protein
MSTNPNVSFRPWVIPSIFCGVIVLWASLAWGSYAMLPTMTERGQFGDLFGTVNALFSGLAFAGVIVALLLQQRELRFQLAELTRSATAQQESQKALLSTQYAQVYKTVVDLLQNEPVRAARKSVMEDLRNKPRVAWTAQDIHDAEVVCHTYDSAGLMAKWQMIPTDYIAESWGDSLCKTWSILKPLVEEYRGQRNAPAFWDGYEFLAEAARQREATRSAAMPAAASSR